MPEDLHLYLACLRAVISTSGNFCEKKILVEREFDGTFPKELFDANGCSTVKLHWVTFFCVQLLFPFC